MDDLPKTWDEFRRRYPDSRIFCDTPAPFNRERSIAEALENGDGDISFMWEKSRKKEGWKQAALRF